MYRRRAKPRTRPLSSRSHEYWDFRTDVLVVAEKDSVAKAIGRGLSISGRSFPMKNCLLKASIKAEGGTVWTTGFDKHYKHFEVSFSLTDEETLVEARIEQLGALLSHGNDERAQRWIKTIFNTIIQASS